MIQSSIHRLLSSLVTRGGHQSRSSSATRWVFWNHQGECWSWNIGQCRWWARFCIIRYQQRLDYGRLHRASWTQTELFLTFPPPTIESITLIPLNSDETAGRFRVWLSYGTEPAQLMWDRKVEGGFPELKLLVMPFYSNGIADIDMLSAEATHQRQGAAWQVSGSLGPEGGSVV